MLGASSASGLSQQFGCPPNRGNFSPEGHFEGALIETAGGTAQWNLAKHDEEAVAKVLRVGDTIALPVELEPEHGDHPVFRTTRAAGRASGTVVRLSYAPHAEANGYHLEDGTCVHVKPDGAKKYKLRAGDQIEATGWRLAGPDAVVLQANTIALTSKRVRKSAGA